MVVAPRMFKHLVGQGHAEFSSGRQQDAAEYMQHLLEVFTRVRLLHIQHQDLGVTWFDATQPRNRAERNLSM